MKIPILISFSVLLFNTSYIFMNNNQISESEKEKYVNNILAKAKTQLSNNYGLTSIGTGAEMPNFEIQTLILAFNKFQSLTKEETRKLLINSTNEFLNLANDDPMTSIHLNNKKYTPLNIEITVYMYKNTKLENILYPCIAIGSIYKGCLTYMYFDSDNKLIKTEKESFDEALNLTK